MIFDHILFHSNLYPKLSFGPRYAVDVGLFLYCALAYILHTKPISADMDLLHRRFFGVLHWLKPRFVGCALA